MGILDRLESVIFSYINDSEKGTSRLFRRGSIDPDFEAAYEELDDFLNQKESSSGYKKETQSKPEQNVKFPPEELRTDFERLEVPFGADEETCKASYKRLLKIHHPDRHAGHEGNFKKATERSARINNSWDRIERWRKSGSV